MSDASTWGNGIAVGGIVFGLAGYAAAWWRFAGSPKARKERAAENEYQYQEGKRDGRADGKLAGYTDGYAKGYREAHRERAQKAAETRKRRRGNAGGAP